ncbi:glycosyltransferase family 9 protein [Dyadobacter tibetensis]|uniref:glycosyltransferase family 9 protein n=1 Tax=Dyadobacter tibetensis TaxID=1211851 RepID=UPI0004B05288|nr:glycosyltransferase family 9 protein [Dyadobacter tibetensis]
MDSKRILIIQTAFIGDVILATALLETLFQAYPSAKIDFLLRRGNEGLLANHPYLHQVLIWEKKTAKYSSLWKLLKKIRSEKYDLVINLQRFGATGILTGLSQAPNRIGFNKNPFSFLFSQAYPHAIEDGVHEIQRNHSLLQGHTPIEPTLPRLYPSPQDNQKIVKYQSQSYICMAPTSVWFTKQYHQRGWIDLINKCSRYQIYLLGAPSDTDFCEELIKNANSSIRIENLSGKLSLLESAALMKNAVMNYVNDSAPMHICSAMRAPVTAIFCSTVPAFGFGPLSPLSHVVQPLEPLACRPCGLHGHKECPQGHFKCATGIQTNQLLAAIK